MWVYGGGIVAAWRWQGRGGDCFQWGWRDVAMQNKRILICCPLQYFSGRCVFVMAVRCQHGGGNGGVVTACGGVVERCFC